MTPVMLFLGRRLGALVLTVVVASVVIFASMALAPGDPAAALAGGMTPNPQTLAAIREQFHLDEPFLTRYVLWAQGLVSGDLGTSFVYRTDVADLIAPRVGTTLLLMTYSAVLILALGIGSGLLAALRGGGTDRSVTVVTSALMGAPTFAIAILLIWVFSQLLNWFPVFGTGEGLLDQLWHLTLPAIAMSCAYLAYVSRMTRTAVREEMFSEHAETARSRGLPEAVVTRRHVMRNASPQVLAVSGIVIAGLLASTAVAESAFGVRGIGSLLVEAAGRRDLPVVQILSLVMVVAFVVVNTTVDLVNAAIDPRIVTGAHT
jgi:peptide/nickel transport system permease protein